MKMKNKFNLRSIIVIIVLVIVVFMGGMYFGGRSIRHGAGHRYAVAVVAAAAGFGDRDSLYRAALLPRDDGPDALADAHLRHADEP